MAQSVSPIDVDPLLPRRINVRGASGVGKSTFSTELAQRLGLRYIELDALYHGPNWCEPTVEDFRTQVCAAMAAAPEGWIIDGSYDSKLGDMVVAAADTLVWLDLPLRIALVRLWCRTMHRIRNDVELWNGNREDWRTHFASRDSLFLWTIRSHRRHRRDWPPRFAHHPRFIRLRSDAESRRWVAALSNPPSG